MTRRRRGKAIVKIIDSGQISQQRTDWAEQLATLTRVAWTGGDGRCHFPYRPLTEATEWKNVVRTAWQAETMRSWALVDPNGRFLAHAALVQKSGYWELGRWVALPDAPKGAVTQLCEEAMRFAHVKTLRVQVECTQAHTASQKICERLGLRFAGIGILGRIDDVTWDIVYFDSLSTEAFVPRAGILGDPLHHEISCEAVHQARLRELPRILTSDRGGELPPTRFHALPHLLAPIRAIVALNT